ncbi:Bowman-Birk type bran trypsin inhibitor-like isoform X2 [Triticum dicoccoides]|uniref:Bowman-Birk type bran trypsin inhibitor-like isoform X2 n=1 Tax=Triticum dicoccoides TaxID=85692 RepID=UPI001890128F|nr:Bowman-Birk type bran trypsin inhibitor-like isoform X2 [Triticum dicoccoides]
MKRCIAAVLLVLSLAAGRLSADDHVDTIRLPSNGLADEVATAATEIGAEKKRPWKCCDRPLCSRSIPPRCRCMDAVEQCDEACTRCEASKSDPSKRICNDRYHGWPGPNCTEPDADDVPSGPVVVARQETVAEETRPWGRCCDRPLCTRSVPPACRCLDNVDRCAPTCKRCVVSIFDPTDHSCDDIYHGEPGPRCTRADRNGDISSGVVAVAAAAETVVSDEKSVGSGEEKARPWKCCDEAICTMSFPPICFCRDRVKKCAKTCNKCDKDESDASRHVCGDSYFGWPGPRCTKPNDDDDVPSGPGVSAPGAAGVGQPGQATAAAVMAVSEELSVVDGEKARPWKCCDQTLCTRSAPPTCFCHDKVKKCAKTCKNCLKDDSGTSLRVCGDPYFGWPGPKCTKV